MQRPVSIVNFERVVLASLALGIAGTFLARDVMLAEATKQGVGSGFVFGVQAVMIAINLALLWFVARKASPVAKWIYVVLTAVFTVLGVIGLFNPDSPLSTLSRIIAAVGYGLSLISIWLLFRPDSNAWFSDGRGGDEPDPYR
jgi:chromate transport protein ChrA